MDFLSVSNKDYIWSQIVLEVTLAQIKLVRPQRLILMASAEAGDEQFEAYRWERLEKRVI